MTDNKPPAPLSPPAKPPQAPPPLPKPNFSVPAAAPTQQPPRPALPPLAAPRPLVPTPPTSPINKPLSPKPADESGRQPTSSILKTAPVQSSGPSLAKPALRESGNLPTPSTVAPPNPPIGEVPPPPTAAEFQKSPLRFLPFIVGILMLVGIGYFIFSRFLAGRGTTVTTNGITPQGNSKTQTVISYWGLWEPSRVLQDSLTEFETQNPGIKVNYQQQTYQDYRERLQTEIAKGRGPDVFRIHASWVPMFQNDLSEVPSTVYSATDFQTTFYPIVSQQLKSNNKFVGVPLEYDGLALFYNKEALRTANAEPPKTWNDLKQLAPKLTIRNGNKIERAGLAIGNATNVDHFSEILGLLMLQNGANPAEPTSDKALEALKFYTDFYTQDHVWSDTLPNSTISFARGDVAMIFAPSWRAHDIIALNPNLAFAVVPVPQLSSNKVTWASYWVEGVNAQSKNKDASWKLIKYLSSQEGQQKFYSNASKERTFGEPFSRVDMAGQLADNQYTAPYLADAPFAKNWYMNSATHDNGLNDQIVKYYEDAVTGIVNGKTTPQSAMSTVAQGVQQVLRQYNLPKQ